MDKLKIIQTIREQLEKDLKILQDAALVAYEAATNEESRPENEYDTRALESSYIAGAQAKRAGEIEEQISIYKYLELKEFRPTDAIASTALVELEYNDKKSWIFMMSRGGGLSVKVDGQTVQVVTPSSPLGETLLGLRVGETALVEVGDQVKEYDILSIR
jgi:transcription elongation GreA/GreB family factor